MKIWLAVGIAAILGIGTGFGVALVRLDTCPWNRDPIREGEASHTLTHPDTEEVESTPTLSVDRQEYDFGVMDADAEGTHDFLFSNQGDSTLTLKEGESTCKCTGVEIETPTLPPGETSKVTVKWAAKESFGAFKQGVTIITNDPNWPQVGLTIRGRVTAAVRADPAEVVFSRIAAGETANATAKLFGYLPEPVEISGFEFGNPDTAQYFDAAFEPLTSDQTKEEAGATSGYHVGVTVKPGLPTGPFRQTIIFQTNLKDHPTVELVVRGTLGSEISVVGPGWNDDLGVLSLGRVKGSEGDERTLLLVVRGPHRKDITFKLGDVFPDILKVDEEALGQTTEMSGGSVTQTALKISIPPGSRPANHWGSEQGKLGRITIETNHPDVPQLRVYVQFVVES